jgi:hypothetical protein
MKKLLLTLALMLGLASPAFATISIPYIFSPFVTISSSQMNTNFSTIAAEAVDKRGDTLTGTLNTQVLLPDITATRNLGSASFQFYNQWLSGTLTVGTIAAGPIGGSTGNFSGAVTITGALTLTGGLSTPLAIAQGGTAGTATPTNGGVVYGTGIAYGASAAGTSGQLLQSNGAAAPSWATVTVPVAVPSGAILYFNAASCPTGWTEFTDGRGLYVVGRVSGGTLDTAVGTALSNQENRTHTHSVPGLSVPGLSIPSLSVGGLIFDVYSASLAVSGNTDAAGSHTHTFGGTTGGPSAAIGPAQSGSDFEAASTGHTHGFSGTTDSGGSHAHSFSGTGSGVRVAGMTSGGATGIGTTGTGTSGTGTTGANSSHLAPYIQLLMCSKN